MPGVSSLDQRMTNLEIAVATLGATLTTKLDQLTTQGKPWADDIETRIRVLESRMNRMAGMTMLGGGFLGTFGGVLLSWLVAR
jgi:uncharacterized coiled-coil protein SlyX